MVASLVMRSPAMPESFTSAASIGLTCRSSVKSSVAVLALPAMSIWRTSILWAPSAPNSLAAMRLSTPARHAPPSMRYSQRQSGSSPLTITVPSRVSRSSATPVSLASATLGGGAMRSSWNSYTVDAWLPTASRCRTSTRCQPSVARSNSRPSMRTPDPVFHSPPLMR